MERQHARALTSRAGAVVWLGIPLVAAQPLVTGALLIAAILALLLLALHRSHTIVSENGALILSLDEVRVRLARFLGRPVCTALDERTPIVIAPGGDPRDPWELEAALLRSGLGLRARRRGIVILPRGGEPEPGVADRLPGVRRAGEAGKSPWRKRILEIAASEEPPALRLARVLAYTGDLRAARDLLRDAQDLLRASAVGARGRAR